MIVCLDVGNTNIKFGLFDSDELKHSWRMHTDIYKTADDYGINITSFFNRVGMVLDDITGIIISSVVPAINYTLEHMCSIYFTNAKPIFVGPGIKTGLNIKYDDPKELGADRIVNAVCAYQTYKQALIVIDAGTALTFSAVSKNGEFLGGAICPGIRISMQSLASNTAKLPSVELTKPSSVISKSTKGGLQSGMYHGYVGLVNTILEKMLSELNDIDEQNVKIVATGGLVNLISDECSFELIIEPRLTLLGLKMLYDKNM